MIASDVPGIFFPASWPRLLLTKKVLQGDLPFSLTDFFCVSVLPLILKRRGVQDRGKQKIGVRLVLSVFGYLLTVSCSDFAKCRTLHAMFMR